MGLDFIVLSHFGSLCAVLIVFRRDVIELLCLGSAAARQKALLLAAGTLPAVAAGLLIKDILEKTIEKNEHRTMLVITLGWFLTGLVLLSTRRLEKGRTTFSRMGMKTAVQIGIAQALAILPGISRSGMTVAAGLRLGMKREEAARFSFLLSVPVILGATLLSLSEMLRAGSWGNNGPLALSTGWIAAFGSGYIAIRLFLRLLRDERFTFFGYYCIAAAIFFGLFYFAA